MSASGYVKGQITRAANALKEKITGTETTMTEIFNFEQQTGNFGDKRMVTKFATQLLEAQVGLSHWMNNLTNAWKRGEEHAKELDEEQTRYQLLQELTDHWEKCSAEKFMINAQLLTQSTEYLKQTMEESLSNETKPTKAYSKDSSELQVQLPRLEIPHFQGDMVEFPEFWELYKLAVHDNTSLGAPAKFLHLKSVLKGTAKDLMATMTLSAENYPKAIELLLNTYNRPDILRNRLIDQLEALPPSGKAVTEQRITLCKVKAIWVQLANLSEQPGSTMTMRMVRSKFPRKTREKVGERRRKGATWTTDDLIEAFDEVIDQLEIIEDTDPTPTSKSRSHAVNSSNSPVRFKKHTQGKPRRDSSTDSNRGAHSKRTFRSKDKPNNTKQQRCSFCLQPRHKTANCDEVTSPYERREAVIHNRLCWKCLKPGHKSQDCEAPACYRCGRNHHKSLCLQRRSSLSPRRPGSPGNRYYRRNSSVDSFSSEVSRRNRSRSSSRSPSPDERGRSPTRRTRPHRRGSPHPKVGFRNQARTYAYSNSSPTPSSDRSQFKHMANSELDSSSEELESTAVRVNTVNTKAIITHTSNKKQRSSKDKLNKMLSPPQLMVVQALTVNKNTKSKQAITVLLDSGSQHSYIKKETAANLGLKLKNPQNITALTFGGHLHTEKSYRVEIILHNKKSGLPTKLHLWTRKAITTVEISKSSNKLDNNHKGKTTEVEVDVLIGMDYYWDVVHFNSSRQLPSGLVESETTLGPVLSGCQSSTSSKTCTVSEASPEEDNQSHETDRIVQHLFGLESLETKDEADETNESIIQHFYNTVQVKDGLIHVQFPWKANHPPLADNKALAVRRLQNQFNKLHLNTKVWKEYCKIFNQQLQSGIIQDVDESSAPGKWVYYIPHQAVFKEDSATTKLRIVFDASSHMKGVPSLNDCVHQGPTLLPDLCGTLLRARLTPILIIADVEKAFHQIRLQEDQRDATRFLWLKDTSKYPTKDNIRILRFTRIPFGVNASPFLLSMSIKYALEKEGRDQLQEEILANTYVDNVIIGAKTVDEGLRKRTRCKDTFSRMGMNLREFMSNSNKVLESTPFQDRMKQTGSTVKLLGLRWDTSKDSISIPIQTVNKQVNTKRSALKVFASTFDPLGLLTPLFIRAKMFIQDLWINKYSWDDPFDESTSEKWRCITEDIKGFVGNVPRFIAATGEAKYDLVIFSDASQRVYAAVAYLVCRPVKGTPFSNLIFAKAKLAVMKKTSIPRLELLGSVLAAKLVRFLRKQINIPLSSVHLLSDSQIALYWIHSNKQLKTFVNNRVKYIKEVIQELSDAKIPHKFHYVNTDSNPADCATRGLSASELANHMWWHGPQFILSSTKNWPNTSMDFSSRATPPKEAQEEFRSTINTSSDTYKSFIPFTKTNSYKKLVRIASYVLKYVAILWRRTRKSSSSEDTSFRILHLMSETQTITASDMKAAEILLLREHYREEVIELQSRVVQRLRISLGEDGIYRGDLRMANADIADSAKTPVLLLPKHQLTRLIVTDLHEKLFHAGTSHLISELRNHYLIPRIRRVVNIVIGKCVVCKKHQGRSFSYPRIPDLPSQRVVRSRPFQNIGLDYFGPITVRQETGEDKKIWVCLFTCMATRALHLEVVADNSAPQFLLAFRRFMARRGAPALVLSDNAPTFKLGREILVNELHSLREDPVVQYFTSSERLEWKFITPLSPWKGGFYERLVGSVKSSLKKAIHRRTLDVWSLQTTISEIESTLNTRPITPVTTSSSDNTFVLRPIDLINPYFTPPCKEAFNSTNQLRVLDSHEEINSSYVLLQEALNTFWDHWQKEYLQNLAERNQKRFPSRQGAKDSPNVGDVVLIKTENTPRSQWPLGLIVQIFSSADGSIRSVKIKTGSNKFLDRSVNQLIPLEVCASDVQNVLQSKKQSQPTRIQPERKAKQR